MNIPADTGILGLIVFTGCVVLFIVNIFPASLISVIGCIFMVLFKVASFESVFGQFASNTMILLIGTMIVSAALDESGLIKQLGRVIHRLGGGSERRFLLICVTGAALLSAFMSNVATILLFMPVVVSYAKEKRIDVRRLLLPVAMASQVGGSCTLIGSAPQMVANAFLEDNYGKSFAFFDFGRIGIWLAAALVIYVSTAGYGLSGKIWSGSAGYVCGQDAADQSKPEFHCREAMITGLVFLTMAILFYLEPVPVGLTAITGAVVCVAAGCLKKRKVYECISWNSVVKLGGCLGLMKAVNQSGGMDLIAGSIEEWIGTGVSAGTMFAILVVLTAMFSEVLSNSNALMLFLPFAMSLCHTRGYSQFTFAMGLVSASSVALSCPLSSTSLMLIFDEHYKFSDFFRYGFLYTLAAVILIIIVVPLIFPFYV